MTAPTRATVIRRASGSAGGAAPADKHWFHCQDRLVQWKSQAKASLHKKDNQCLLQNNLYPSFVKFELGFPCLTSRGGVPQQKEFKIIKDRT